MVAGFHPGPGKTAPRLVSDLLDHDPRRKLNYGKNILADEAPQHKTKGSPARKHPKACRHKLMLKEAQTVSPRSDDERPRADTKYVVNSYCHSCSFHFNITVDYTQRNPGQKPCHLSDEESPLHHFRLMGSTTGKEHQEAHGLNKYEPITENHRFVCTAPACPAELEITISAPRLGEQLLGLITDRAIMFARGQREIKNDPTRYEGQAPVEPAAALLYLKSYLNDAKGARAPGSLKKIARRNKKYMIAFANECDAIFDYLDFVRVEEPSDDPQEGTNHFWQLPLITDENREFIDDVLFELDVLLQGRSQAEQQSARVILNVRPVAALKYLELSLGCHDYPKRSRTIDLATEEHPYYLSLGAVDNFTDVLLSWAYDRQCLCDPVNTPYYFDCLQDLANGRESSDLQLKVTMALSTGQYGMKDLEDAYKFFGLDPDTEEGDEHVMGLYKSRIISAPRQKEEAKNSLLVIAKHRNSGEIEALANDKKMTFEEALEFLGVSADTASDSIEAVAVAMVDDADKSRVARALRVIAGNRGDDYTLIRAAASMELGGAGSSLSLDEAYSRLQIKDPNVLDELVFTYYQSLTNGAPTGSKDSYNEALRTIALQRDSNFLLRKLEDPNAEVQASTAEPVGLDNIGNTCYLNSLLQYYYTVKPVRDMVIDFQNHRMELTPENLKIKRVGGRIVDKPEIIKAQKFVDELHDLFENLKTANTRSIKPTKELAELTIFSSEKQEMFRRTSISSPSGPPDMSSILGGPVYGPQWPPPPPTPPPTQPVEDDIEMVDGPIQNTDARDDSSEATLVDIDQLPPLIDSEGNEVDQDALMKVASKIGEAEDITDAVMVNSDDTGVPLSPPEKPPPIPPRNKSGLVISTNERKDLVPDDELWRFGTQQDVTEVIGNVTFRLQCAIKPTSLEEGSGEQIDIIRDTFFGTNTTYTQKATRLEKKVEAWPTIIVFPGSNGVERSIYEAIDVVYDEQTVEVENTTCQQYASISKLPPILQITIQRTDFDPIRKTSFKNRSPVNFPETLYLDRYVDTEDPDSTVMRRRRETWKWKSQLRVLEARQAALINAKDEINVADALIAVKAYMTELEAEEIEDIEIPSSLTESLEQRISELTSELESISTQITALKRSLEGQFMDLHEHEYKLHSVFIHRGEAGGGHYWVYIYDFERDIWREYNDEHVSEIRDTRRIFEKNGSAGGTPYYLVYVQTGKMKDLVDVVCRDVQEVPVESWPAQMEGVTTEIEEVEENGDDTRHIEHAKPRPLLPKPPSYDENFTSWNGQPTKPGLSFDANGRPW